MQSACSLGEYTPVRAAALTLSRASANYISFCHFNLIYDLDEINDLQCQRYSKPWKQAHHWWDRRAVYCRPRRWNK